MNANTPKDKFVVTEDGKLHRLVWLKAKKAA
jgi:hypothetical protein